MTKEEKVQYWLDIADCDLDTAEGRNSLLYDDVMRTGVMQ